ncbi:hypothetical protein BDF19DRAFT_182881 [Syncephalis fuscata]|nr:hypothetical protein BDF19DRAFT_182881 [Syncephalis fuscata]
MRADIDAVDLATIPIRFKHDNCLYPRADVPLEEYRGNRWRYENECNNLGWRLAWLNREVMSGKRGLLQRAVDSYRNRYRTMRSRRVARLEKMATSTATTIITDNGRMGDESDGLTGKSRKKTTDTVDLSSINTAGTPSTLLDNEMIQNQLQHEISDDKLIKNESATNNNSISISLSLSASSILSNSTDFGQLSAHLLVPATLNETASPLESTVNHATSSLSTNALINTAINVASIADSTEWSAARSRFARVPKYLVFEAVIKGASTRVRIRVDPTQKEAALNNITEDFRRTNALYPRALCPREQYAGMRYELETRCNQLACELAALNPVRLNGRKALLQKAVDAYRKRFAFDWRPRRGKTALLIRVAAETAAMAAQQHSPTSSSSISAKLALNDTNGPTSNEEHNKTNDGRNGDGQNHTLSLLGVTPASTPPDVMSLALSTGESVNTSTTATTLTDTAIVAKDASSKVAGAISHASLSDSLDYLRLPTDNMHFQSLDLSELEMLTQELSGVPTSNTNSVAINSATPVCLSNHEAQLQALLMDDDHELHDHHNEALLVKQLEEAFQRSSHGHDSSGNNSHISTTVTTPAASNHDMVDHGLSAVDLMHALQHH